MVWVRVRRRGVAGVCRWTDAVVGLDAPTVGTPAPEEGGAPAGAGWMVHVVVAYVVVYVLHRLAGS